MTFVDTNILIRLITNDVPHLRQKAETVLSLHGSNDLFIPDVVFTELFFVLENNPLYRLKREEVCEGLNNILLTPQFSFSTEVIPALKIARSHPKLDFTDCLLAVYSGNKDKLITFDKALLKAVL